MAKHAKHFIQGAVSDPGYLRRALHIKAGQDIPQAKLDAATHSKNKHLAEAARLAETFKHMHHGAKKGGK